VDARWLFQNGLGNFSHKAPAVAGIAVHVETFGIGGEEPYGIEVRAPKTPGIEDRFNFRLGDSEMHR
jgi:hypothetical protein